MYPSLLFSVELQKKFKKKIEILPVVFCPMYSEEESYTFVAPPLREAQEIGSKPTKGRVYAVLAPTPAFFAFFY